MTCQELIDFLMRYLDGELTPPERQTFEEHLGACPPCVTYLETYRETVRVSRFACHANDETLCNTIPEQMVKAIVAACLKK
jgi:anti-sigma factor RsiW